jgi:flagellar M-ring protein FliF
VAETIDNKATKAPPALGSPGSSFKLPAVSARQFGMMAAVAMAIAIVVTAGLWFTAEPYRVLFNGQSEQSLAEVVARLDKLAIDYRIDPITGVVEVRGDQVHRVRLQLAGEGLPRSSSGGFELLDQAESFGTSEFMERARYQRALEGELARSVMTIGSVRRARVHLALSKQSLFVRDRKPQSASVLVELYPGRTLERAQVQAITNLVAASVPQLSAEQITVVDQLGNLHTERTSKSGLGVGNDQLEYTNKLEARYIRRIEEILTPIVGVGNVRAQITVDADFSTTEETQETFDDIKTPRVRSEQLSSERSTRGPAVGIPGALSNQPPAPTQLNDVGEDGAQQAQDPAAQEQAAEPVFEHSETVRNYELDKRVRHTRRAPGAIRRVTAAVVVADRTTVDADGEPVVEAYSAEQLERITALVREAIGFDSERGDRVTVVNASFAESPFAMDELPETWWKTGWFLSLVRLGVVAILIMVIAGMVIRPVMRTLIVRSNAALEGGGARASLPSPDREGESGTVRSLSASADELEDDVVRLGNAPTPSIDPPTDLNSRVKLVKDLVSDDPQRAVQVVKQWVTNDA